MGLNVHTIGRPGGLISLKDYYIIEISTLVSDTTDTEIISAIAFGDPAVRVSSGAVYDVKFIWDGLAKRGFASSTDPQATVRRGLGGDVLAIIDQETYTGGSNDCGVITPMILQGDRVDRVDAAVSDRRYRFRWNITSGVGHVNCDQFFNATLLMKLVSGTVQSTPGRSGNVNITVTKVD